MENTIIYNGRHYDLGAKTEQEYFDKYIELDKGFVELFKYDIKPID